MTADILSGIRKKVFVQKPVIHAITNPISISLCANAVLAAGGRPIMAEHPSEVAGITAASQALLLNLGNITDIRMKSMMISAETAAKHRIPTVLDAVGVACSPLRRDFAINLLNKFPPHILKGNYSELLAIYNPQYSSVGVDSSFSDTDEMTRISAALAQKYGCIITASGKTDIITDGNCTFYIKNGTPALASVSGTGCMLGILCALYLSVETDVYAAIAAAAVLGISGELADSSCGIGSFQKNLMDRISQFTYDNMKEGIKIEKI